MTPLLRDNDALPDQHTRKDYARLSRVAMISENKKINKTA